MLAPISSRLRASLLAVAAVLAACGGSEFSAGGTGATSTGAGASTGTSTGAGGTGGAPDTSASSTGGGDEASSVAATGAGGGSGCDADLQTDPTNCGKCGHDCLGGGCSGGQCQPFVIDGSDTGAYDVALDDDFIFWTVPGTETSGHSDGNGVVRRANLSGGSRVDMATSQPSPTMLALTADLVFWTDTGGALSSGAGIVVSTGKTAPCGSGCASVAKGLDRPFGIAVSNGTVYWTELGVPQQAQPGSLWSYDGQTVAPIVQQLGDPTILAFDANVLYFSEPYSTKVLAYNLVSAPVSPLLLANLQGGPDGVAVDASYVYFVNYAGGKLMRVGKDGSGLTELATSLDHPALVALDAGHIYWTAIGSGGTDGVVQRMKKDCTGNGCVQTIATGQCKPTGIAVDATAVYWANAGASAIQCQAGAVMKVAK